jgi:hypothetical protein
VSNEESSNVTAACDNGMLRKAFKVCHENGNSRPCGFQLGKEVLDAALATQGKSFRSAAVVTKMPLRVKLPCISFDGTMESASLRRWNL